MTPLKHIVVATDFSENSKEAVEYAADLAKTLGANLTVVHVVEDILETAASIPNFYAGLEGFDKQLIELKSKVNKELQKEAEKIGKQGVKVKGELLEGNPTVELIKYPQEHPCDLLVLGTHGRTGIPHLLIGSVAEKVVRKSSCAVLTVRKKGFQHKPL